MDTINLNETLAIDFGTTNSIVYYYQNHRYHAVPSVRYGLNFFRRFDPENPLFPSYVEYDGDRVDVGANARRNMGQPGKYVVSCVKRILGLTYDEYLKMPNFEKMKKLFGCEVVRSDEDEYPRFKIGNDKLVHPVDVASEIFKTLKKAAEEAAGHAFNRAYVTVPANFREPQREAVKLAAVKAGLAVEKLIIEPSAAAMSWCYQNERNIEPGSKIVVFDFGGGTFDVSLLTYLQNGIFSFINSDGDPYLGGNDVDSVLYDSLLERYNREHPDDNFYTWMSYPHREKAFRRVCEEGKINLTKKFAYLDNEREYRDRNNAINEELEIVHNGFSIEMGVNDLIGENVTNIVNKAISITERMIHDAYLSPFHISTVILVGGSSNLHRVRQLLKRKFVNAKFPKIDVNTAVAKGAMEFLYRDAMRDPSKPLPEERIVISYGLLSNDGYVYILLKKGDTIHSEDGLHSKKIYFENNEDFSQHYNSEIYQWVGNPNTLQRAQNGHYRVRKEECIKINYLEFPNKYPQPAHEQHMSIQFSLQIGGTLMVHCRDEDRDEELATIKYSSVYGGC